MFEEDKQTFDAIRGLYLRSAEDAGESAVRQDDLAQIEEYLNERGSPNQGNPFHFLPEIIQMIGRQKRRQKNEFINRMRDLAALCQSKGLARLTIREFQFPPAHVNVDQQSSRVSYIEEELVQVGQSQRKQDLRRRFSSLLWTSEAKIKEDITLIAHRHGQADSHSLTVGSTENHLALTLNKAELIEVLLALQERISRVTHKGPLLRAFQAIWTGLDDYSKNRMKRFLPPDFIAEVEEAEHFADIHRRSPHESASLFGRQLQDESGWLYFEDSMEVNWLMHLEKSGWMKRPHEVEVRTKDISCLGRVIALNWNKTVTIEDGEGIQHTIDIPSIIWSRLRQK